MYLHDQDVLALAQAAKQIQKSILFRCKSGQGEVRVTASGFSGLWQRFDLWEVAFYLNDLPRAYHLPLKFLSEYTLRDAREARFFASAAHKALHMTYFVQNRDASDKALAVAADAAMGRESTDGSQPQY